MMEVNIFKTQYWGDLASNNTEMKEIFAMITKICCLNLPVIITGESGTGKSMLAETIHHYSNKKGDFISKNCAGLTMDDFENTNNDCNLINKAHRGTLSLDEISDISKEIQSKILCILEHDKRKPKNKDRVRFICTTNKSLAEIARKKLIREDLLYRLSGIELHLPALRERKEDIPLLIESFMEKSVAAQKKRIVSITDEAVKALMLYDWPGNIHELYNVIARVVALKGKSSTIKLNDLSAHIRNRFKKNRKTFTTLKEATNDFETRYIQQTISYAKGNKSKAADLLGISRRSLYYKLS